MVPELGRLPEGIYLDGGKRRRQYAGVMVTQTGPPGGLSGGPPGGPNEGPPRGLSGPDGGPGGQVLLGMKKLGFGTGLWQHSFCGKVSDFH